MTSELSLTMISASPSTGLTIMQLPFGFPLLKRVGNSFYRSGKAVVK